MSGPSARPWITVTAIVACIGVYLCHAVENDHGSWEVLLKFGILPAESIRRGRYWPLITNVFVHFELWHVAFNVYWLWKLGSCLEKAIGSLPYLGFFLASAFVSSSFQLAMSDGIGIGASGVVYAIFGFMRPTRLRYTQFNQVLDSQTIQLFVGWMIFCVVAEVLQFWKVGNAAHISGFLFGGAVAGSFVLNNRPRLMLAGMSLLVVLSIIPLFWCPWSISWLSHRAYNAHAAEHYETALKWYTQIIQLDPQNAWAYRNRSGVYGALGESDKAAADLERVHQLEQLVEKN